LIELSDQLRELADLVERVDGSLEGEVEEAQLTGLAGDGERLRADLTMVTPIRAEVESPESARGEETGSGDFEEEQDDEEYVCDVDGCSFSSTSERGLAIHQARTHDDDGDAGESQADDTEPSLEARIVDILDEHGELPSSEIELLLETSSDHYRNVLSSLKRDGRVETRSDPEDRRRNLYRLVDENEDGGPDDDANGGPDSTPPVGQNPDKSVLDRYNISQDELVGAIEGAQSVHHVQRELGLDREATTEIISELGLLEQISTGCPPIPHDEAVNSVREVIP